MQAPMHLFSTGAAKVILVVSLTLVMMTHFTAAQHFDLRNIDSSLPRMLNDDRYMRRQIRCLTNQAGCDQVGRTLKSMAPVAIGNGCRSCDPTEKFLTDVVLDKLRNSYPHDYRRLVRMYG